MMASTFCHIRRAVSSDAQWIVSIYNHVQAALTASGSLQQLTKPSLDEIYTSIRDEYIFILEGANTNLIIGAVTISVFNPDKGHGSPGWDIEPWGKMWYLHSLAIEPTLQRQGLGAVFLKEALSIFQMKEGDATIALGCWAGNGKLRAFYAKVGFDFHGEFPKEDYEVAVYRLHLKVKK